MMKRIVAFGSFFFLVIYAPALLFYRQNILAAFQYFTTDTFYYLSTARHSSGLTFFTSDGSYPTNGFHPLWQFFLTFLFGLKGISENQALQILWVYFLSAIFVAAGAALFGMTLIQLTQKFPLALIAAVPGFYYFLFSSIDPQYNSTWAFINGMESPFSILFFGLLVYLLFYKKILTNLTPLIIGVLSLLLTLITFSRLDDIFLFVPFSAILFFLSEGKKNRFYNLIIFYIIPVVSITSYMIFNLSYAGTAIPISGLLKGGFWAENNFYYLISVFLPVVQFKPPEGGQWGETAMRALQMCIPPVLACIGIGMWSRGRGRDNWGQYVRAHYNHTLIIGLCVYVLLKGFYNFAFVNLWGQGHWYYSISIMIFNLLIALLLNQCLNIRLKKYSRIILCLTSVLWVILAANSFTNLKILSGYNAYFYDIWLNRQEITDAIRSSSENSGIVEMDDGIISYALDIPTMNGFGYTLDKEAVEAKKNGKLLSLAYQRGFRLIGIGNNYLPSLLESERDPDSLRKILAQSFYLNSENLDQWDFKLIYINPQSETTFIQFQPDVSMQSPGGNK